MKNASRWVRVLLYEGTFLLGVSLGWALNLWSARKETILVYLIFAASLGLFFMAALISQWLKNRQSQVRHPELAINLDEQFEKLQVARNPLPLFSDQGIESFVVKVLRRQSVPVPTSSKIIVHHLKGEDLSIKINSKQKSLKEGEVIRFEAWPGELLLIPEGESDEGSDILIYVLPGVLA